MRITKLDGLRGIFSLMMIFYHYEHEYINETFYNFFLFREDYPFVEFFIVLSGFVIAYNYNVIESTSAFWTYLKKRFARLYPLLFFTAMLMFGLKVLTKMVFPALETDSFSLLNQELMEALLMVNSTPLLGKYFGIVSQSWSISSEMISYIIFGLVVLLFTKARRNYILGLVILGSGIFLWQNEYFFTMSDYGFVRGLISFSLGYFVWLLSHRKMKLPNGVEYLILPSLLTLFYLLNSLAGVEKQMFGMVTIPLFFSLVIFVLLKTDGFLSRFLDLKPIQFLGKISYSVYLNHIIIIVLIQTFAFDIIKIPQTDVNEIVVFFICVGITVLFSTFTYHYVERRLGKRLRKILLNDTMKTAIAPQQR